jgi:hypothetical protein
LDYTSLFATSIAFGDGFAIIGSSGWDIFEGLFTIYKPVSEYVWEKVGDVTAPAQDLSNFGMYVIVDGTNLLVAANGFNLYQGLVYFYTMGASIADWNLEHTFYSPLEIGQGFGSSIGK